MKSSKIDKILKACPNTALTARAVARIRILRAASYIIPRKDIKAGESGRKKEVVDKYTAKQWIGIKRSAALADRVIANAPQYREREDTEDIKTDMLFCRLAYGFEPDEYLDYCLEGKKPAEIKKWISDLDRYVYIFALNNFKSAQIFNNKAKTYEQFGEYYGREAVCIKDAKDFPAFEKFLGTHSEFVKKKVFEGMGRSVELVKTDAISPREYFDSLISKGEHIIEERIQQNSVMSTLNESSVNTIRCITLNTRSGVSILSTFLKVGRNGSFVDNGGAGGIIIGIDKMTGKTDTHGYDEFGLKYVEHPDTHIVFKGYEFPQWEEMKDMCCEMAAMIPDVKCIGWDLTLTDKGWVVVEGNGMTQFIGPQSVYRRGMKKEIVDQLKTVDLLYKIPGVSNIAH